MIVERIKVHQAYRQAAELGTEHEEALASAAQVLCLPLESVREVMQHLEDQEVS
jgi:hypothetical protein